ncbi:MAG: hypothetical protein R2827_06025 [Bdellovibrionales bacterium]
MKSLTKIALFVCVVTIGVGCTKKKPYDQLDEQVKVDDERVDIFKPLLPPESTLGIQSEEYIMMVSNIGADRISPAITYYKGYSGKVVFDMTEEGQLKVVSLAENFTTNPLNNKTVMTIPVAHADYRCSADDFEVYQ